MKFNVKVILVVLILMLSIGPLSYFLKGNETVAPSDESANNSEQPTNLKFSKTLVGKIVEIDPYITYNGISDYNNMPYVNQTMAQLGVETYTASVTLNPEGRGYIYNLKIWPNNTNFKELGFRLAYKFEKFFTVFNPIPIREAKLTLPNDISLLDSRTNETIKLKFDNETLVNTDVLYWQNNNTWMNYYCPELIVRYLDFTLLPVKKFCGDATETYKYGLPEVDFNSGVPITKLLKRKVVHINGVSFIGPFQYRTTELNATVILKKLKPWFNETTAAVKINKPYEATYSVDVAYTNQTAFRAVEDALEDLGLNITESYPEGEIFLPGEIILNNTYFDLAGWQAVPAKLKWMTQVDEEKMFNIAFYVLYNEVYEVKASEN